MAVWPQGCAMFWLLAVLFQCHHYRPVSTSSSQSSSPGEWSVDEWWNGVCEEDRRADRVAKSTQVKRSTRQRRHGEDRPVVGSDYYAYYLTPPQRSTHYVPPSQLRWRMQSVNGHHVTPPKVADSYERALSEYRDSPSIPSLINHNRRHSNDERGGGTRKSKQFGRWWPFSSASSGTSTRSSNDEGSREDSSEPEAELAASSNENDIRVIPTASMSSMRKQFNRHFTVPRNAQRNLTSLIATKRALVKDFKSISPLLQTRVQTFYTGKGSEKGHNIVAWLPGRYYGTPHMDSAIVVGAHFDTVYSSPGVDDNGSGSVLVMQLAKMMVKHQCKLNSTVYFVLFDLEESVSWSFVCMTGRMVTLFCVQGSSRKQAFRQTLSYTRGD